MNFIFQQVQAKFLVDVSHDFKELIKEGNSHGTV